jgi:hypothetical protein
MGNKENDVTTIIDILRGTQVQDERRGLPPRFSCSSGHTLSFRFKNCTQVNFYSIQAVKRQRVLHPEYFRRVVAFVL